MTNEEKFNDKIIDLALSGKRLAINKKTLEPCACDNTNCLDCAAYYKSNCVEYRREWANAEYIEPCPFEKDELVEVSADGENWCLRYFSHIDENENYRKYRAYNLLLTSKETLTTTGWVYCRKYGTLGGLIQESENE